MGYADVREQDILAAIRQCDELGRDAFRERYGIGEASRHVLVHNGRQYDSTAIVGAAHEFVDGRRFRATDFVDDWTAVRQHLERLGFVVQERDLPPQLLLQPRGGSKDNGPRNFVRTVVNGVRLDEHAEVLGSDLTALRALFRDGVARLWGATSSRTENAKAKAIRGRQVGDHVLFYANRSFIAEATIAHLFHNPAAARSIWPTDAEGRAFEHLVALVDVRLLDPPFPAGEALRRVCNREDLRSLTLVPAAEYATIAEHVPTRPRLEVQQGRAVRHTIDMSSTELVKRVTVHLRQHAKGQPSRHQPLALLWALGRMAAVDSRLHPWHVFKPQVGELLIAFGGEGFPAAPELPFWQLRGTGVWEVEGIEPTAGFEARSGLFDADDPSAGFTESAYRLLRDVALRTRVINALRARHLADIEDSDLLLERVGLADYATASGGDDSRKRVNNGPSERRRTTRDELVRKQDDVRRVKAIHDNRCQLCGLQLVLADRFHSEAAHIRGLGRPHDGPDELSNLLCVCPNCHVQFDSFAIYVDEDDIVRHVRGAGLVGEFRRHADHEIEDAHLRRHQSMCDTTENELD